jgi:signal peptidase
MSGSMEPTIHTGSLAFTHYQHPNTLQKDDIITFIRPAKEHDFITHRVFSLKTEDGFTTFKTKGDHNQITDPWSLAGGGVVGKVMFTIPYLGYFMAFLSSKLGIFLFVLVPSVYIIIEEINYIKSLFSKERKHKPETAEAVAMLLAFITASTLSITSSHALLNDSVELTNNQFTLAQTEPTITPTITPAPSTSPCGITTTVHIIGNGADSNNNVTVINKDCSTTANQSNTTSYTTSITRSSITGGNTVSGSTGKTAIITGNSNI